MPFFSLYKEIEQDVALRMYGGFLAWMEPLAVYYWVHWLKVHMHILTNKEPALCSPIWQDCGIVREWVSNDDWYMYGLVATVALGALSSLCFWFGGPRRVKLAHTLMILAVTCKCAFVLIDFRLDHNVHKMALWTSVAFLFLPNKRDTCRVLLSSFYFWAGWIKTNQEWLSGAALMGKPLWPQWMFPPAVIPAACAYAIFMEVVSTWGLLCSDKRWLGLALLQFGMFHFSSIGVVGCYYPINMCLLLSLIPLISFFAWRGGKSTNGSSNGASIKKHDSSSPSLFHRFFTGKAPTASYAAFFVFAYCNMLPHTFPGDKALSGEGRVVALHMVDANIECNRDDMVTVRHLETNHTQALSGEAIVVPRFRMKCDPYVAMQLVHMTCRYLEKSPKYDMSKYALDVELRAKKSTDEDHAVVVKELDMCRRFVLGSQIPPDAGENLIRYKWWDHNDWIFPNELANCRDETGHDDAVGYGNETGHEGASCRNETGHDASCTSDTCHEGTLQNDEL